MSYFKIQTLFFLLIIFASSCVPSSSKLNDKKKQGITPPEEGYAIMFYHLDNYALIYNNDQLIADTRELNTAAETDVDILIDLNGIVENVQRDQIKIEGYNSACDYCRENRWKIVYEIFKDGESLDYIVKETLKHDNPGLKFTERFNLNDLTE